jgi:hypothetical protein
MSVSFYSVAFVFKNILKKVLILIYLLTKYIFKKHHNLNHIRINLRNILISFEDCPTNNDYDLLTHPCFVEKNERYDIGMTLALHPFHVEKQRINLEDKN